MIKTTSQRACHTYKTFYLKEAFFIAHKYYTKLNRTEHLFVWIQTRELRLVAVLATPPFCV
jgi:hypothetical protein